MTPNPPEPDPYQARPTQPGSHGLQPYQGAPYGQRAYPPNPYLPGYPQPIYIQAPPTSGAATASLVLGIIGLLGGWCAFGIPCIIAVVLGHLGMSETKNGRRSGRSQAIAGLILGYLVVVPAFLIAVWLYVGHLASQ